MQGRFIFGAIAVAAFGSSTALAGEPVKRWACNKTEQSQSRQQPAQQQRVKPQGCPVQKSAVPPVVDPTPTFLL